MGVLQAPVAPRLRLGAPRLAGHAALALPSPSHLPEPRWGFWVVSPSNLCTRILVWGCFGGG